MGKMLVGAVLCLILIGVATYFFVSAGGVNVAANAPADWIDAAAPWVLGRSLDKRSAGLRVQVSAEPAAIARGLAHYRENCLPCHGAPGVKEEEFAQGMNPMPPGIDSPLVQRYSDGQLFWIVKNGVRMTGMPAFGGNHSDDELRDIVAFVRHLPKLETSEKAQLGTAEHEPHHH